MGCGEINVWKWRGQGRSRQAKFFSQEIDIEKSSNYLINPYCVNNSSLLYTSQISLNTQPQPFCPRGRENMYES